MSASIDRREFLAATGAAVLLPLTGTLQEDACDRYDDARADLEGARDRLADAESALERTRTDHDELLETVRGRYYDVRGPPVYDEATRTRATEVALAVRDAVVYLDMSWEGALGPQVGTATGWFRDDGVVVTNAHNVNDFGDDDDPTLRAWTADGDRFEFEIVDYVEDLDPDVAALETDLEPPGTIPFGSTDALSEGDHVVQVGHPGGFGNWVLTLGELRDTGDELVSTVPGLAGVSGSPVVDLDGRAVGLTHGGTSAGEDPWIPGTAPEPAEPTVHQYPFQLEEHSLHVPIERVRSRLEEWL